IRLTVRNQGMTGYAERKVVSAWERGDTLQPDRSSTPLTTALASIQWLFFMFANIVVIPISIGQAFHLPPAVVTASLERAFIYTGIACLLQGTIGHRLTLCWLLGTSVQKIEFVR